MVRAGEASGVLDSVLQRLASTIEKQVELRRKVKSAMTYPVVVWHPGAVDRDGDAVVHHPDVQALYKQLGGKLPMPTPGPHRRLDVVRGSGTRRIAADIERDSFRRGSTPKGPQAVGSRSSCRADIRCPRPEDRARAVHPHAVGARCVPACRSSSRSTSWPNVGQRGGVGRGARPQQRGDAR